MTTAADYIDRRFDVLAFRGAVPVGEVLLEQSLFDSVIGGEVCTGAQKLAQRWALEFLTPRGSMAFHMAARGSDFLNWVQAGRIRTEFDVQAYFNFAAQQVKVNLVNEETADWKDDERIVKATLDRIVLVAGTLELYITIVNRAGSSRQVILPITFTPANITI